MRHKPLFKMLCTVVLFFYGVTAAQAGQVIMQQERDWAKQALSQEAQLGTAPSSKSIAVLNFHNKTSQQRLNALEKGFALMLITDLSKVQDIIVVERIRMQALLDEMNLGTSGLVDRETAPRVGKLLTAYYVVNGDISDGAIEELQANAAMLDIPFGGVTELPPAPGNLDELFRMEKDVLFSIIESLHIYISPEKKRELEVPLSWSTPALLALFLGIDLSDRGSYKAAADMYNRAIAEDPDLQLAKDALQELQDLGLMENEDVSRIEPEQETPPAEEGGSGAGIVVGVGLAIAAIAGGAALLASSSSSDSGNNEPVPPDQPTATPNKTEVSCLLDEIIFTFSQTMNTDLGYTTISPETFGVSARWLDAQNYQVSWEQSNYCYAAQASTIDITLNNFRSAGENGASLGGQTTFTVTLTDTL